MDIYSNPTKFIKDYKQNENLIQKLILIINNLSTKIKKYDNNIVTKNTHIENENKNDNENEIKLANMKDKYNNQITNIMSKMGDNLYNTCVEYFYNKDDNIIMFDKHISEYNLILLELDKKYSKVLEPDNIIRLNMKGTAILFKILIMSKIHESNIKYNCKIIRDETNTNILIGGNNMNFDNINYKLGKYISKDNLNPKYLKKIEYYIDQLGGNELNQPSIKFILSDKFHLITDIEKYKHIKEFDLENNINYDKCIDQLDTAFGFGFDNVMPMYKINYLNQMYGCIKKPTNFDQIKLNESKYFGILQPLKGAVTELFMYDILYDSNEKYESYKILCEYIYYELMSLIHEFISEYNIINSTNLTTDDISLLYKSGNTTRMYISLFYNSLVNKNINAEKLKPLKNILDVYKVGDFDYNIKINYKSLIDKKFTKNQLDKIINYLNKIIILGLHKIKKTLQKYFNTDISTRYANNIDKIITNTLIEINENLNNININSTDKEKINKISYKEIRTFNYKIQNTIVTGSYNNTDLYKESYIVYPNKINNIILLDKVNSFLYNNDLNEFLPDILEKDNIYIAYINNIIFYGKIYGSFILYRLKFNNNITLLYEMKNDGSINEINKSIPIELIDISINDYYDSKSYMIYTLFLRSGKNNKYSSYLHNSSITTHSLFKSIKKLDNNIKLPSAEYMYYDIILILFIENIFVWYDRKYKKRFNRLFILLLISLLNYDKYHLKVKDIKKMFTELLSFFKNESTKDLYTKTNNIINDKSIDFLDVIVDEIDRKKNIRLLCFNNPKIHLLVDYIISGYYETILILNNIKPICKQSDEIDKHCKHVLRLSKECDTNPNIYTEINGFIRIPKFSKLLDAYDTYTTELNKFIEIIINILNDIISIIDVIDDDFKFNIEQLDNLF